MGSRRGVAAVLPALCEKALHPGLSLAGGSVGVMSTLALFPDTAAVADEELLIRGVMSSSLAEVYGTPVVVYCERTLRS